ncbi:hypothetical protein Pla175_18200 [Pirellulimonas nuda]|uniref:Uncharacterized protein n=1 Tax=Pirellulimonas nuda TaxID=2528009 RepID=A0A518DAE2_9BACT|nr:hypothetical protein [Pirellulimonas nuda]QDU88442.1 hypothetical protein Pla175_18200 [Pirellulimonas nuda]
MPTIVQRPATRGPAYQQHGGWTAPSPVVTPSIVAPGAARPFTLDQELEPFGAWSGGPIWVPPKDASAALAESMLRRSRPFTPRGKRWQAVIDAHRAEFTQVREIDLLRPSIRLPQGRFFVTVTEQQHFDQITDTIPACVQTRLDEFLAGPGRAPGVKVYYLKPLCVEAGDELILTDAADVHAAVAKIQQEVFAEYRRLALVRRPAEAARAAANLALALPRSVVNYFVERRQKAINAYQARLEFKRRRTALDAANTHCRLRTNGCTFDEMLALTTPLNRADVVQQYCLEQELSSVQRKQLLKIAAGSVPWFMSLSLTISHLASLMVVASSPVIVCDPAFVAELPGSGGVVLKIGHFDEVGGVTHVEI